MKKTIRLFLCILSSVVLILGCAGTVFAQESVLELPVELKIQGGKPMKAQDFTIVLEPVTEDAPMPQGCEDSCTLSFTGDGRKNFPAISYGGPGVYHYRLYQVSTDAKYYSYDSTVYELGVYVCALPGGGLDSSVVLNVEGREEKMPDALFINTYHPPERGPHTGDPENPARYFCLASASALCLLMLLMPRRKED